MRRRLRGTPVVLVIALAIATLPATGTVARAAAAVPRSQERLQACAACHGEGGNSRAAGVPSIAGQPKTFLETQLILFREGVRVSPFMQPVTEGLSDREIMSISAHFSASAAQPQAGKPDPALVRRGRDSAQKLLCGTCHLPDYRGRDQIPRLAGQREDYLADAMIAFRDNRRIGGDTAMSAVLYGVSDSDIRAMAHFLARER